MSSETRPRYHLFAVCLAVLMALPLLVSSAAAVEVQVAEPYEAAENNATPSFPDSISFTLRGEAPFEVERVELLYSIADNPMLNLATPPFESGSTLDIQHDLETRVNFIPPGVDVTYRWRLIGPDDAVVETEPRSLTWTDDRFDWQTLTNDQVTVYSYHGNEDFSRLIVDSAQQTIERLRTKFGVDEVPPIRIWAYNSRDDFRGTQLGNSEAWIVGTAYPQYQVILAVLPEGNRAEIGRVVPHEISHQVLYQATINPFNVPPTWLDEGLAVLNQDGGDEDYPALVEEAAEQGKLFSVRALVATPPLDPADAGLYYAESLSVVRFIIDHFGAEAMAALIDVYREGVSHDEAAMRVLGVDLDGLDELWKESLGYQGDQGQAGGITPDQGAFGDGASLLASGALMMGIAALVAVAVGFITIRRSRRTDDEDELDETWDQDWSHPPGETSMRHFSS